MKFSTLSDKCLLNLLQRGDDLTFKFLYDKYWDKLYNIALKRLDDQFEAEEVVQDIYTNLWKNKEKLNIETEFSRYLSGAVKFEIINRLVKRMYKNKSVDRITKSMYMTNDYDVHDRIDYQTLLNDVDVTIQKLPAKCKTVFTLSRNEYFSHRMIAEQLQISEKTVQKHITFALKLLRERHINPFYILFLFFFLF